MTRCFNPCLEGVVASDESIKSLRQGEARADECARAEAALALAPSGQLFIAWPDLWGVLTPAEASQLNEFRWKMKLHSKAPKESMEMIIAKSFFAMVLFG